MQNLRPVIALFLIALACGFLLATVNSFTHPRILVQEEIMLQNALNEILYPDLAVFEAIEPADDTILSLFAAVTYGEVVAYIMHTATLGYSGNVNVLTGIDVNGSVINVRIGAHAETPGLGSHIERPAFTKLFTGSRGPFRVVAHSPGANDIQAIASATISTAAVTDGVNAALLYFNNHLSGAN